MGAAQNKQVGKRVVANLDLREATVIFSAALIGVQKMRGQFSQALLLEGALKTYFRDMSAGEQERIFKRITSLSKKVTTRIDEA